MPGYTRHRMGGFPLATSGVSPWMPILSVLMELLVLAIPVGIVLVIVGLVQYFRPQAQPPSAEETLRRRFAGGEISRTEYDEMLRALRGDAE